MCRWSRSDSSVPVACVAVTLLVTLLFAGGLGTDVAGASHAPNGSNFTYTPLSADDRQPGAEDTRVGMIGQAAEGVDTDFDALLQLRAVWEEGSWTGCGPSSSEVFGIDRNSDNEPYNVDEDLTTSVKSFTANEDVFESKFYDEDDFGESVHLNSEDRTFSVIECPDNPAEPGWHRIDSASVTGRTADGEEVTFEDPSHWFWICECEDETEARDRLGPPPSEPTRTATPTQTPGSQPTATASTPVTQTEARTTPTPTESNAVPATTTTGTPTPTTEIGEWRDYQVRTPTVGTGVGFTPLVAIGALLVATGLVHWRRRE